MSQQQQEQPVTMYPNPVIRQPSPSHSKGSFGPVFIVLAVIVVVSGLSCVLGRLCSRRSHRGREVHHHPRAEKQSNVLGPKEWESRQKQSMNMNMRDGGIEFGFDHKRIPSAKVGNNGNGKLYHDNGGQKPEVRFAENV